ncbi:DNA-binding domain-containing protein [uncultured Tateyamaria sp.]|uniref:HvfC/BufC N-terminal domain-containing protein n=1 Tax=uncultured Tateyamaria sp. TaxID=455651 RepID=UPI00261CA975|nr:DNA-binding domain-containing protein [uncultured Tateyamaria sp.]
MHSGQSEFRTALLDPAQPVPNGLTIGQGKPITKRFAVYRNNVTVALVDALKASFPVLRKLLGDKNFDQLAPTFARAHPPSTPLMMHYGAEMPAFLAAFQPLQHIGYLADVARLEVAMRASYHAADTTPLPADAFGAVQPEALLAATLTFAPTMHLIRSDWPLYDIWRFNMEESAPKPRAEAQSVLITRPEFDPIPHPLDPAETAWISAILNGDAIEAAQDAAVARAPDFDLSPLLTLLVQQGALTHLNTPKD